MTTPERQLQEVDVPDNGVAIFWFGQNSFAVKDQAGTVVLIDPYFPIDRPGDEFIYPERPVDETRIAAHAALVTHDHGDHTCVESLLRLRQGSRDMKIIGPPESISRMAAEGLPEDRLEEIQAGGSTAVATLKVHAVLSKSPQGSPARGITPPDCTHLGFVVETSGGRIYISGDAQNDLAEVDMLMEPVKALAPEIGLLTTHPTEGEFPFFAGSVQSALRIGLKVAIPAHYNCFVKRNYDPVEWAKSFPAHGPARVIIPYRGHVTVSVSEGWIRCG